VVESGLMSDLHVGRFDVVISMCVWYETLDLDLERSRQTPNMRYRELRCGWLRRNLLMFYRRSWRRYWKRSVITTWRHRTRTCGNWRKNTGITSRMWLVPATDWF